jgi:hypothetical protein
MEASHRVERARGWRSIKATLEGITGVSQRLLQLRRDTREKSHHLADAF